MLQYLSGEKSMKAFIKKIGTIMLVSSLFFGCATTDTTTKTEQTETATTTKTEKKKTSEAGEYVGQYDESMTPENSCVIIFPCGDSELSFKQINPQLDIDEQHFSFSFFDIYKMVIFKPCKPGSRYMLTKQKGSHKAGNTSIVWDFDFKPNQQYMVIDVPSEPGIYIYSHPKYYYLCGFPFADKVDRSSRKGKKFDYTVPEPNQGTNTKQAYKYAKKSFKNLYFGTPWYEAFIELEKKLK